MPLTMPSANKKARAIKWDAEPALPRSSTGWEKVVAIGFATALGAGAVAAATILMVASPAESEWQPRPLSASIASTNNAKPSSAAADEAVKAAPAPRLADAPQPVAGASAAVLPQTAVDAPADAVPAVGAPAAVPAETAVAAVTADEPAPVALPNEQRWARSVRAAPPQPLDAGSELGEAAGAEESAPAGTDEQRVAAIPLSALVAEPVRPAEPEIAEPEIVEPSPGATEPAPQRKLRLSSSANLRSRPANGSKVLGTISGGTSVASFGCKGSWCEVSVDGKRGFIASRFLGEKSKVRRASATPAKKKQTPKSKKRAPQRKAAAAAPIEQTEKAPLPGVFATVPATANGDR